MTIDLQPESSPKRVSVLDAHLRLHAGTVLPEVTDALGMGTRDALAAKAFGELAIGDIEGGLKAIWLAVLGGMF